MAKVVERLEFALALHCKGKTEGIVTKMFKGMNQWWNWEGKYNNSKSESEAKENSSTSKSEAKDNSSKIESERKFRLFSLAEIKEATEYFNNDLLIAHDDSSKVYKGFIDRGTHAVAIKITKKMTSERFNHDDAVTRMHSQICHDHVISLIGFCPESYLAWIHVYDYMVNRSLQDHIYQTGEDTLAWKKRLEICIGAARGLQYLLAGGLLKAGVLIKPSKILLDEKLVAKIQINLSPEIGPTFLDTLLLYRFRNGRPRVNWRYLDPNFVSYGVSTRHSVMYSFGIVLFEVLCAKEELLSQLMSHFGSHNMKWRTVHKVIDPYLMGQIAPKCLRAFLNIAYSCVHSEETERPSMNIVLNSLLSALQLQEDWETQVEVCADELPGIGRSLQLLFHNGEFTDGGLELS